MKVLVTGGAGFIGRWLVKKLIEKDIQVTVLDNFSNGRMENISEFVDNPRFKLVKGDIRNEELLKEIFKSNFEVVYHLAAEINVQKSLDDPYQAFQTDLIGTLNLLENCRKGSIKFIFVSTCMVYEKSFDENGINENHPVKPASPYAATKLSGEYLTLSYHYSYELPSVVLRPFNTYGPYQKKNGEGGVVAIFSARALNKQPLQIYGSGLQTRDFLYVEDCVEFIRKASESKQAIGQVINAGTGVDISINDLAEMIANNNTKIEHVPHIHPQSEIMKLKCDISKAHQILNWKPIYNLEKGLEKTEKWISTNLCL